MNTLLDEDNFKRIATAFNKAEFILFEPLLSNEFVYTNQRNGIQVSGKQNFLNYIQDVFEVMKFDTIVFAEQGYIKSGFDENLDNTPCIILSEKSKGDNKTLILVEQIDGKVSKINICIKEDPRLHEAVGTNVYPGYVENIYVRYMHFTIRPNKLNYLSLCNYANKEYSYVKEPPINWSHLREWFMRYTGVFDYVYEEACNNPDVITFKKSHLKANTEIMRKNYDLIDTYFIDQDDCIDFLVNKSLRTIANDEGTCFAELKKEDGCFLYTLTWAEDGKFVGDYVKPFKASLLNIDTFNKGCKILADRLFIYIETNDMDKVPSSPPAFGELTISKNMNNHSN